MLVLNTDLWSSHQIIKVTSSSSELWAQPDSAIITKCGLDQIKTHLEELRGTSKRMVLILDLSTGCFPPWFQALSIARFFVGLKLLLIESLDYTIMYISTETQKAWISRILKIYTPARPVHTVETKDAIMKLIKQNKVT